MEGIIGYVTLFAGNFAPMNWAFCQGQTLNIQQYTALYAIIGTYYGGNGTSTFQLPNLMGRDVVGAGKSYTLGEAGGTTTATLGQAQMPVHSHPVTVVATLGSDDNGSALKNSPVGNVYTASQGSFAYASTAGNNQYMAPYNGTIAMGATGSGTPFSVISPYLGLNYVICLNGIFPSRD